MQDGLMGQQETDCMRFIVGKLWDLKLQFHMIEKECAQLSGSTYRVENEQDWKSVQFLSTSTVLSFWVRKSVIIHECIMVQFSGQKIRDYSWMGFGEIFGAFITYLYVIYVMYVIYRKIR